MHAEPIMIAFGEEHYQLDGTFSNIVETSTDKRDGSYTKTKVCTHPFFITDEVTRRRRRNHFLHSRTKGDKTISLLYCQYTSRRTSVVIFTDKQHVFFRTNLHITHK